MPVGPVFLGSSSLLGRLSIRSQVKMERTSMSSTKRCTTMEGCDVCLSYLQMLWKFRSYELGLKTKPRIHILASISKAKSQNGTF